MMHEPGPYLDVLRRHGVSLAEWAVLRCIGYGPKAIAVAAPNHEDLFNGDVRGIVSGEEARNALSSCLTKSWIEVVTDQRIKETADDLKSRGVFGPVYGMPSPGEIDFTPAGARLYTAIQAKLFGETHRTQAEFGREIAGKEERYFLSQQAAAQVVDDIKKFYAPSTETCGPVPIGPWCVYWWEEYPAGFRIDLILKGAHSLDLKQETSSSE